MSHDFLINITNAEQIAQGLLQDAQMLYSCRSTGA